MNPIRFALIASLFVSSFVFAQQNQAPPLYPAPGNPADAQAQQTQQRNADMPVFRVNVYARSARAVNYRNQGGSTTVDMKGTDLMPEVTGKAKVDGKAGRLAIHVDLDHMQPPIKLGAQYLTYVLWAVTPDGRAVNLGEIVPGKDGKDSTSVTTDLQAFALIVTAEPYFAVTHPSEKVVAENHILPTTKGFAETVNANFDVLEGREYTVDVPADQLPSAQASPNVPLDLLEARNAVAIAKAAGAQQYADSSLMKAEDMLQRAENYYERKQGRTPIGTAARGATELAEDARVLSLRKQEQAREQAAQRANQEAQAKAQQEAQAAQQAEQQAQAQANEDARRRAEAEQAQAQAQLQKDQALAQQQQALAAAEAAQQAADDALRQKQEAQEQQQQAQLQAQQAQQLAQQAQQQSRQAQQQAQQAEQEKQAAIQQREQMRARLMAQLNQVLQTRDTARGLIVSMPDVLFAFDKYDLKPDARERLAKISGILLAYPGLKLEVEGHTDNIGSDEYNDALSEKRADSVRSYLISSGVPPDSIRAVGLGKADPVADNSTAEGRQMNRRVDIIVSGDVIGTQIGTPGIQPDNGNPNP
jgi:outer membrane protein OmpA-like peptidoglycan-associated protein